MRADIAGKKGGLAPRRRTAPTAAAKERARILTEIEAMLDDWTRGYDPDEHNEVAQNVTCVLLNLGTVVAGGAGPEAAEAWSNRVDPPLSAALPDEGEGEGR